MKTASDELHKLIHSLTRTEKRYFKLHVSIHSSRSSARKYVQLFNKVERMKVYDERKLKAGLKDKELARMLKTFKGYLTEAIMDSLVQYNQRNKQGRIKLFILLSRVFILYGKHLLAACEKTLDKAQIIAEENDLLPELQTVLLWKTIIASENKNRGGILGENNLEEYFLKVIEQMRRHTQLLFFGLDLKDNYNSNFYPRSESERNKLQTQTFEGLLAMSGNDLAWSTKRFYYTIKSSNLIVLGNYREAISLIGEWEQAYRSRKKLLPHDIACHLAMLNNKAIVYKEMGQFNVMAGIIEQYEKIFTESQNLLIYNSPSTNHIQLHTLKLEMDIAMGNFSLAQKRFIKFKETKNFETVNTNPNYIELQIKHAMIYFGLCDFKTSLQYLNKAIPNIGHRIQFAVFVKIIQLANHFELKNTELIPYITRSLYRLLKKKERLFKVETILLRFFQRRIYQINTRMEMNLLFKEMVDEIKAFENDPNEKIAFYFFDYVAWLQSKINSTTYAQEVSKRAAMVKEHWLK
ncbi:MAG: hypothetical protein IT235_07925 [Bacteroidia bacterium]|nr:hypothetical protein [Bacteroidia bacterium]